MLRVITGSGYRLRRSIASYRFRRSRRALRFLLPILRRRRGFDISEVSFQGKMRKRGKIAFARRRV